LRIADEGWQGDERLPDSKTLCELANSSPVSLSLAGPAKFGPGLTLIRLIFKQKPAPGTVTLGSAESVNWGVVVNRESSRVSVVLAGQTAGNERSGTLPWQDGDKRQRLRRTANLEKHGIYAKKAEIQLSAFRVNQNRFFRYCLERLPRQGSLS